MSEKKPDSNFILIVKSFELARDIVKTILYLGLAYFGYQAVSVLAGKTTDAKLVLSYFTSEENKCLVPLIAAAVAVVFAVAERNLRRRKTEYLQGRIRELELKIDPDRTTSGLLTTGDTNPRHKL